MFYSAKVVLYSFFFFSSRRRHTRSKRDWSSDVCSSDLRLMTVAEAGPVISRLLTEAPDPAPLSSPTLYGVVLVQVTLMLPDWLTAEASTACAGKATGLLETLQPALIVNETPSVVVAVPASAGCDNAAAASRTRVDAAMRLR